MAKTYTLHVAGLTRELPICKINDHLDIAAFIMFSDVELTIACAKALLEKCPDFDVILTAEAKGIPLAYEMSRQSGKQWIPARKGVKGYMADPVIVEDQSITTAGKQTLVIDKKDLDYMNGKRILVVDDVISTGGSLHALDALAARSVKRLNRTIQITDTGINPGSGVGNHRHAINKESMGIPVIAIGIPTVVDAATIVSDTMSDLIGAMRESAQLKSVGNGLAGLDEIEKHELARELLSPHLNAMFVTPKDIDEAVKRLSYTISEGLNLAFSRF